MEVKISLFNRVKRSVAKSITFRILVVLSDFIVIYLLTHKIEVALGIIFFTNALATLIYFIHERVWKRIRWGKIQQ